MSNDRLSAIRERLGKATPGGWLEHRPYPEVGCDMPQVELGVPGWLCEVERQEDATFIAHAPEDIAWLLERVGELERTVEVMGDLPVMLDPEGGIKVGDQSARIAALEEGLRKALATISEELGLKEVKYSREAILRFLEVDLSALLSTPQPQAKEEP